MEERIFDEAFFKGLNRVKHVSRAAMQGGRSGMRRSKAKGSSVEFADFREYVAGDDIRRIDWNTYGRTDKLFVKLFIEERETYYSILTDASTSMEYGTPKKSILAAKLAGALTYMALDNLDRVRLLSLYGDKVKISSDYTGRQGFKKALSWLENVELGANTDLNYSIRRIPFHNKGVTILISDFFSKDTTDKNVENILEAIRYLRYMKQEIILLHVLSPQEISPELEGTMGLIDSETEEMLRITATSRLCRQYKEILDRFCIKLEQAAKKYQAHYIQMCSDETIEQFIYRGIKKGFLEN